MVLDQYCNQGDGTSCGSSSSLGQIVGRLPYLPSLRQHGSGCSPVDRFVLLLLNQGVAPNASTSYQSGLRRYQSFCTQFNSSPFPLLQTTLCRFVAFLHELHLSASTICLYLSALRFHQISLGGPETTFTEWPQLHYVLRAVYRTRPVHSRPTRLPITPTILRHLYSVWCVQTMPYSNRMLWAACCLGFSAFLRSGEFTCPSLSAYVSSMLSPRDIATDSLSSPTFLAITLRSSKTDLFGTWHSLYIGATGNYLCPVAAILSYMAIRPPLPGPLFIHENGRPLSLMDLVQAVWWLYSQLA